MFYCIRAQVSRIVLLNPLSTKQVLLRLLHKLFPWAFLFSIKQTFELRI